MRPRSQSVRQRARCGGRQAPLGGAQDELGPPNALVRRRTPFSRLSIAADTRISPPTRSLGGNDLDAKAAEHLAAGLKANSTLKELRCAATRPFPYCQEPLTLQLRPRSQSVRHRARSGGRQAHLGGPQDELGAKGAQVRRRTPFSRLSIATDTRISPSLAVSSGTGSVRRAPSTSRRRSRSIRRSRASSTPLRTRFPAVRSR